MTTNQLTFHQFLSLHNCLPSDGTLQTAFFDSCTLTKVPKPFDDFDYETVRLKTEVDGSISGTSLKPYNLLKVDMRTLRRKIALLFIQTVTVAQANSLLALGTALLQAGLEVEEMLHRKFDTREAQVLAAVLASESTILTQAELQALHFQLFEEHLEPNDLQESLWLLSDLRTLRLLPNGDIQVEEEIIYERP